jgi:hypothetical protein
VDFATAATTSPTVDQLAEYADAKKSLPVLGMIAILHVFKVTVASAIGRFS